MLVDSCGVAGRRGMNPRVLCGLSAMALLTLTGCVHEDIEGTTHTFTYEWWVPLSTVAGGLVASVGGWFLKDTIARLGWGMLIAGPLLIVLLAPSMFFDKAVVDETGMAINVGIWGSTSVHDVRYQDLQVIRIVMEESRGRRGRIDENYYLVCTRKDGTSAKVPLGGAVAEEAALPFLEYADAAGVPIVNET